MVEINNIKLTEEEKNYKIYNLDIVEVNKRKNNIVNAQLYISRNKKLIIIGYDKDNRSYKINIYPNDMVIDIRSKSGLRSYIKPSKYNKELIKTIKSLVNKNVF